MCSFVPTLFLRNLVLCLFSGFFLFHIVHLDILEYGVRNTKMFSQIARSAVRKISQNGTRSYHPPKDYCPATMDDILVPQGSWQKHYDERQKVYNLQFLAGITSLFGTLIFIYKSDLMFFNFHPPARKEQNK